MLFAGMLMYVLGFEFEILGLSVLVYAQTRSAFLAALAFSMGFAPQAIGGALFTSLADRLPPRGVIAAGLLTRAAPGLVIGMWPTLPVPAMLTLVAAAAMVAPVFSAAVAGLLPDVLDGDRYVLGRSVFSLTSAGAQIAGLGIGGAVLAVLSARSLLLAAGGSLVVAALIMRLGLRARAARAAPATAAPAAANPAAANPPAVRGAVSATVAGNVELLSDQRVRGLLLAQWLPVWCVTGAESLIVPYTGSLGQPASAASPLLAAVPAGMLLSDVLIGRFCRPAARQRLAFPLATLMGAPLLVLVVQPPLAVAGAALFLSGLGSGYQLGIQQAFLDSLPARLRGQAFGLSATGGMGGQGLLPPAAGGLAAALGAAATMAAAGAATILAALALHGPLAGRQEPSTRPPRPPVADQHPGELADRGRLADP